MQYTSKQVYEFISTQQQDPIFEWRICEISGQEFPIFESEQNLLKKLQPTIGWKRIVLPLPTICPEERQRRRNAYRNLRTLYHDQCDLTSKKIISRFHPDMNLKVYANDARSSDGWDSKSYGKDIDNTTSILSHITTLLHTTPYQDLLGSLSNVANNAVYTNGTADVKDCYLVFDAHDVEQWCYITRWSDSKEVSDCLRCSHSELCYECVNCDHMFHCVFAEHSTWCDHCYYIDNCHGCHFCIWCTNLINKQYYLYNQPSTKEYYEQELKRLQSLGFPSNPDFEGIKNSSLRNGESILHAERSIGSNIKNSKDITISHTCRDCSNILYCTDISESQDCMDIDGYGHNSFLMYNSVQVGRYSNHIYYSASIGKSEYMFYCFEVKKSHHCFWCVNMRDVSYCIFNKQYTKEDRERIVPQLIERMQAEGSRWQFPDILYSPFPYNDSDAQQYFPLHTEIEKGDHLTRSHNLHNDIRSINGYSQDHKLFEAKRHKTIKEINIPEHATTLLGKDLPQNIVEVTDDITTMVIICETSGRPYRITPMELAFYHKMSLPVPRKHPDIRHAERMHHRPKRELHLRSCPSCQKLFLSSYDINNTPWTLVCQDCYQQAIYQ